MCTETINADRQTYKKRVIHMHPMQFTHVTAKKTSRLENIKYQNITTCLHKLALDQNVHTFRNKK